MTTIILLLIAAVIITTIFGVGQWFKLAWDYGSRATSTGPKVVPIPPKKAAVPPSGNLWN